MSARKPGTSLTMQRLPLRQPAGPGAGRDSCTEAGDYTTGSKVGGDVVFAANSRRTDTDADPAHPIDAGLRRVAAPRQ